MNRAERVVLAVDLGTGGPKVGFVSLDGTVLWSDHVAVATEYGPSGAATQDAGLWWEIICDATRRGLAEGGVSGERVTGVSITGQWASTVPVDAQGRPVGPCVMWMDSRGEPYSRKAFGGWLAGYRPRVVLSWLRRNGGVPSPNGDDPVGHMLHLQHGDPAVFAKARWLLEPVDYLSMCFTGRAVASPASMTGSWLTDNRNPAVLDYDDVLVRLAGVDRAKLPPLLPTGSIIGPVAPEVAAELGISPAAKVVTGSTDMHSAAVGSGAVQPGELHLTISTTSWISCPMPSKKTDVFHQLATVPGLDPSSYLLVDMQDTAGRALEWLRDNVFDGLDYDGMTELAAGAPVGSNGVIFTPWLKGERSPVDDRRARGGFHNLSLATTRADLVRAVLEGVAYNSRWLLQYLNRFAPNSGPIRIIGGGARSDLWCQIMADVTGRTYERVADPLNAQLRGAALFAGIGLGELHRDELRHLTPLDGVFEPEAGNREVYDRIFAEFPKLYKAQKGMFGRLN
ncbi:xylulokinase [Mycolicibacter hiberniae]|uniref:Carbohydrate kinase n=1 Tax=Mycolicibacter hiberniae TaxID=29314 RepID=A0A7I7X161_9MYCO|nr:FGGY-family carbohydrate kinase [Mycolicibacter hiberniae]MCV7085573.1 FGGY-family carbohydrate kinase [Mycolicibacter hiberniae]ORV71349.1 carbohydrate kinase [Mycolicibacter hiberniae]BBZ22581.1 carbohydrate kinase [Mycolicibacter hiberniae]